MGDDEAWKPFFAFFEAIAKQMESVGAEDSAQQLRGTLHACFTTSSEYYDELSCSLEACTQRDGHRFPKELKKNIKRAHSWLHDAFNYKTRELPEVVGLQDHPTIS